jgi:hypothetical protein
MSRLRRTLRHPRRQCRHHSMTTLLRGSPRLGQKAKGESAWLITFVVNMGRGHKIPLYFSLTRLSLALAV